MSDQKLDLKDKQNCGTSTRVNYSLIYENSKFTVQESSILGWLKMR